MTVINMHDAKTSLSDLVARAEAGEEIVIARRNKPAVKLVPVKSADNTFVAVSVSPALEPRIPGGFATPLEPFEHAPDDYISKKDIAAYYRKYPQEWNDMRGMVGFAEDKQAEFDIEGLRDAVAAGREFAIMEHGKEVAHVIPAVEKLPRAPGRFAHLRGNLPPDLFDQPLSDDELEAWEGKYSSDGGR